MCIGRITVVNRSNATLTNIVASGYGFSAPFVALAPGAEQKVTLTPRPRDKGGIKLEFDADGKRFSEVTPNDLWSGMKGIILNVTTNFSIICDGVTTF